MNLGKTSKNSVKIQRLREVYGLNKNIKMCDIIMRSLLLGLNYVTSGALWSLWLGWYYSDLSFATEIIFLFNGVWYGFLYWLQLNTDLEDEVATGKLFLHTTMIYRSGAKSGDWQVYIYWFELIYTLELLLTNLFWAILLSDLLILIEPSIFMICWLWYRLDLSLRIDFMATRMSVVHR